MKLLLRFAHLALDEIDDLLRLGHGIFFAVVPTITFEPSNKITEGVIRSLSALGMICGLP